MIKYDIDGLKCLTKCYFVDETHIGSYYCTTKCPYFIKNFEPDNIIHCQKYNREEKLKRILDENSSSQ